MKRFAAQEHRIVFVLIFRCAEQFYVPNTQEQSKTGKNQKSTDKHSSFAGLIQEDIDLSDIYLAVHNLDRILQNEIVIRSSRSLFAFVSFYFSTL